MRSPSVFAKRSCLAGDPCDVFSLLHGPHRVGCRLVMILLSQHGCSAAQIAGLLGCHPSTVRRWVHRYNTHGAHGLGARPRPGRTRLGSRRLGERILRLLDQPKAWMIGRLPIPESSCFTGARCSLHDNPVERSWGALKAWLANSPTRTIQGRVRQVHAFFRQRSPTQMLAPPRPTGHRGYPKVTCRTSGRRDQPLPCPLVRWRGLRRWSVPRAQTADSALGPRSVVASQGGRRLPVRCSGAAAGGPPTG